MRARTRVARWLAASLAGAMAMLPSAGDVQTSAPPGGSSGVAVSPAEEAAVRPLPGQVLTVRSTDAVTRYLGVSAGCTASVSAGTPRTSGSSARAMIVFSRTSGCTGTASVSSALDREACGTFGCSWTTETSATHGVAPGQRLSALRSVPCGNTDSDRWRSKGRFGSEPHTFSSTAWLSCGM